MQTFATTAPITTVIDLPAGRIRLVAGDRADTTVEVRPADAARGRDVTAAEQISVDYADGVLRIAAAPARHQLMGPTGSVEITVRLPAGSHVEAKVSDADVRGTGRLGDVTLTADRAAVELAETAAAHLTVLAGSITVGRLGGPAGISTDHGDIDVAEAVHGAVVLRTRSGDVTVGAARGVSAVLDAATGHGRIGNALRNDGTPGLTISATTGHGDITARSL
ncbi:DUF4097 family beta strand repeat-containing protein [Kitasatospora sp. NPDC048365]|uniref:DUF4097 family beta strand repeat-containing protein n=1 Tax=Kitasatospora sp. NPDC048365 TaxID=3364050 RepID=UPI00371824F6